MIYCIIIILPTSTATFDSVNTRQSFYSIDFVYKNAIKCIRVTSVKFEPTEQYSSMIPTYQSQIDYVLTEYLQSHRYFHSSVIRK